LQALASPAHFREHPAVTTRREAALAHGIAAGRGGRSSGRPLQGSRNSRRGSASVVKSNMLAIEPVMLSKLVALRRWPSSQLSSMKRRIEV
jgi:hypothetical protein